MLFSTLKGTNLYIHDSNNIIYGRVYSKKSASRPMINIIFV